MTKREKPPLLQHMGVEVEVLGSGFFTATIRDVVVRAPTFAEIKGEIEDEVKKAMADDRKTVSVHVVLLRGENMMECHYRGVSARDGALLVTTMEGKKEQVKVRYGPGFAMMHPDDPDVRKVLRLVELRDEAKRQAEQFTEEIAEVQALHKVEIASRYMSNDRTSALRRHDHIMGTLTTRGVTNADD